MVWRLTLTRGLAVVPILLIGMTLVFGFFPVADAESLPPVADAGPDQTVYVGDLITLDGTASTDDVGIVNYTWTFGYGGLNRTLTGAVNSTFKSSLSGLFNITLNVTDADGNYDTDIVAITILERPTNTLVEYWWAFVIIGCLGAVMALVYLLINGYFAFVSEATREKSRLLVKRSVKLMKQLMRNKMGAVGIVILIFFGLLAVLGPTLAPYKIDATAEGPFPRLEKPSSDHWMGTSSLGFDIFSELLYGARISIVVGVFSAIIASILGATIGLYSGFVGGWKDEVIMRINDVVLSIPWLVLMILVAAMLGEISLTAIILIIGLTGWSGTARLVRAQVMSLRERMYIERARAIGSGDMHIISRHILPNAFPLVFANTILTVAISILSEATLSFLKMRPMGTVTWGTMLSYASEASAFQVGLHWWIVAPGLCIVFLVLGFTLLGHALDEITNPRLRRR
jgi:peptide/nickel transport system permease protein